MRNDLNHPFTNKLVNGLYPPGSIIKMGVALSFLENGIPEDFTVQCSGSIRIGNRNFRCWKTNGHGKVDFRKGKRIAINQTHVVKINYDRKNMPKFTNF